MLKNSPRPLKSVSFPRHAEQHDDENDEGWAEEPDEAGHHHRPRGGAEPALLLDDEDHGGGVGLLDPDSAAGVGRRFSVDRIAHR